MVNAVNVFPFYRDARSGVQDVFVSLLPNDFVAVPEGMSPPPATRLSAVPNPFRGTTHPGVRDESISRVVQIVTVDGRVVRRLRLGTNREVRWDGLADGGQELAPGIYFARVEGVAGPSTRLVKLD